MQYTKKNLIPDENKLYSNLVCLLSMLVSVQVNKRNEIKYSIQILRNIELL